MDANASFFICLGAIVKRLLTIILAGLILSACQQEEAKNEPKQSSTSEAKPQAEPEANAGDKAQSADNAANSETEHKHADGKSHSHSHAKDPNAPPYRELENPQNCEQPVVVEFFAYQCPHCYNLEPEAEKWRAKNAGKVKFLSIPTHLGRQEFGSLLLVHHAANKMGVLDKVQHALFERVHKEQKLFESPDQAVDFLVKHASVDRTKALEIINDQKSMGDAIQADFSMMAHYKITHVPQIMVNHKYITDITSAGGKEQVFELVDDLLEKEHSCEPKS